jgi:hypothetical protein
MDLVRKILMDLEACEDYGSASKQDCLTCEGTSPEKLSYHVMLLDEAGLIEAIDMSDSEGSLWEPVRLTWEGHEFLDAAREPSQWAKAKKTLTEKTGGIGFEVLKELLKKWAMERVLGT